MKKYLLLIILILFSSSSFSQDDADAMTKLKNVKELFEMGFLKSKKFWKIFIIAFIVGIIIGGVLEYIKLTS